MCGYNAVMLEAVYKKHIIPALICPARVLGSIMKAEKMLK
jgi:hypothetical protein